ncbi:hypothetical protein [Nitrosomonas sp.]|nr:hypothetical protein [Nitrosomonas sp.]
MPLTSEEVYKGIIDDDVDFPDDVLAHDFGAEYWVLRNHQYKLHRINALI